MALSRTHQLPIKAEIENPCMGKDGRVVHAVYEVRELHGNVSEGNLRTGRNVEIKFNITVRSAFGPMRFNPCEDLLGISKHDCTEE